MSKAGNHQTSFLRDQASLGGVAPKGKTGTAEQRRREQRVGELRRPDEMP
jgi:hypothetical protein